MSSHLSRSPRATEISLGAPCSSSATLTNGSIPTTHVHDELDPPASHDEPTDADEKRIAERLMDQEKATASHEGETLPSGLPYPSVPGAVGVTPTLLISPPAGDDGADPEKAAALAEAVAKDEANVAANFQYNSSTQVDSSATSSSTSIATPKKRLHFGKSRKTKEEKAKTAKEREDEANTLPPVSFLQLFRFAKPFEVFLMIIGLILAAASGAAQPLMTLIFGRLTTSFTDYGIAVTQISQYGATPAEAAALEQAKQQLKTNSGNNALYLLAIGLGMFVSTWAYMFIWNYTGELNSKRVRENYLRAVLRQEVSTDHDQADIQIAYFDDLGAGEVATRIQTDCHLVQDGSSERVALVMQYIATFITGFALAFARGWRLALAVSSILPVIVITGVTMMGLMSKYSTASLEAVAKAGTLAEEVIGSIRTIQAFGTSLVLGKNFDKHIDISRRAGSKGTAIEAGGISTMFFSIYSGYALAFFYGGILVTQHRATSGIVINVFLSILIGSFSMAMLTPEMQALTKARGAAAKLFDTIDRVPLIDSADPGGLQPESVRGTITFENVKFHYPSRANIPILKGLTTTFEAGHTIALVGASGSGKSTVVSLVERFYDPISGVIRFDGRDIKSLNIKWLRQQIGLVSQEPTLFGTTVRGNVEHGLIGSKWADAPDAAKFELVQKACIDANAHDFIMKLPNGYDTMVGERGMLLSGGQKQRVAIARAVVSDPRILLLDEATSALDTQSEGIVQDALDKASRGRTTITIAHRLSTIKDADLILVMGGGEILEQGTHYSLLADEKGAYAQLVSNQKLNQTAAEPTEDVPASASDDVLARLPPDSPITGKFPGLTRAATGPSLASALVEDIKTRRDTEIAEEDHSPSAWWLYSRLLKMNREDRAHYMYGTAGAICAGMVYPALSILFGKALQDFQIREPSELKHELTKKA
jgi:ATP-binding cassette subfamily B (MDR/TAP) protein 1